MKQEKLDSNFNVGNSTKENIEYAFKNLLFYVNASIYLDIYIEQKELFQQVLIKITNVLSDYINSGHLSIISDDTLKDIKFDLIDLDVKTKALNSYYAEWALLWLEALISLRMSELKNGGVK